MEDLDITSQTEATEWGTPSPEAIREKSEKQRESYKKAQAQIQRAQKDEKKAKQDNDELFQILLRFIKNPYYESLVPRVTDLLIAAMPSRPIIWMIALIYPDAAHYILHTIWKTEDIHILKTLYRYDEPWVFHEWNLHETIRKWMSIWIDSFDKYMVSDDASIIMQKKFIAMIDESEKIILWGLTDFLFFFFESRNIIISYTTTESYARFILKNLYKTLETSLSVHPDKDIILEQDITDSALFWL